ncbi:MAG: replication-relaxation family protein, partial [Leucobacter sp.]
RDTGFTAAGDADHVVTELFRVGLGHDAILPGPPSRASQIRSHLNVQQPPRTKDGEVDEWFFEVDRATEAPGRVVRKCLAYQEYRSSGKEQQARGVFPAVAWIVPSEARKRQLRDRINSEVKLHSRLFLVLTLDELPDLIADGAATFAEQAAKRSNE